MGRRHGIGWHRLTAWPSPITSPSSGDACFRGLRADPSAAVLDLACGPGTMASVMARMAPPVDVVAVDLSVGMLHRAAREVTMHRADRCAAAAMDAHLLGFVDRAFEWSLLGFFTHTGLGTYRLNTPTPPPTSTTAPDP